MSDGFSGSNTRSVESISREVEKRLDIFTDSLKPGADAFQENQEGLPIKGSGPYSKPHEDSPAEADKSFYRMDVGQDKHQEYLDEIDESQHHFNSRIKPPEEQFPMGRMNMNSEKFNEEVDKRMKKLEGYNADEQMRKIDGILEYALGTQDMKERESCAGQIKGIGKSALSGADKDPARKKVVDHAEQAAKKIES